MYIRAVIRPISAIVAPTRINQPFSSIRHMTQAKPQSEKKAGGRRYRGLTAEQLRAERRTRLLDTALALYAERGYAGAPIEMLCAQAKVTTRHFYEQFKGREELLRALFLDIQEQAWAQVQAALQNPEQRLVRRVEDALAAYLRYVLDDPRRARIVALESVGVSPEMERTRRESMHAFTNTVAMFARELIGSKDLPDRDYRLPAVALVGAVLELISEWLLDDGELTADGLIREAILIFRALIIGAARYDEHFN